jgi:hypothetical protein
VYLKLKGQKTALDIQASNTRVDDTVIHGAVAQFCHANSIPVSYRPTG